MANLTTRFGAFETQTATQHTAIANKLDAILAAMGAPPPTATVTLGDVATLLNAINNNLIGLAIANGSFHTALLEAISNLSIDNNSLLPVLEQISTNTDTIINNNSLNAQRMIAATLALYCQCGDGTTAPPLFPPPLNITPTTLVDEAKCRRIQFYLNLFLVFLGKVGNYGGAGAFITGDIIGTLLGLAAAEAGLVATGAEVGSALGPPGAVVGAVVTLIVGAIGILGASVLSDYYAQYAAAPVQSALLAALYNAMDAGEGSAALHGIIGATFEPIPAGIINALWWASWLNDIYADTPVVDDSAFDGSICGTLGEVVPPCVTISSELVDNNHIIYFPPSHSFSLTGDFYGSIVRVISGINVHVFDGTELLHALNYGDEWTVDVHTTSISINTWRFAGGPSVVEWCDIHNAAS